MVTPSAAASSPASAGRPATGSPASVGGSPLAVLREGLWAWFEHAPDGIFLHDLQGRFIDGNRAAEALIGYARAELIGQSWLELDLLGPGEVARATALLGQLAAGQATGPDEFRLRRKDGGQVLLEIRTYPVRLPDQTVVLGIARDMTARQQAADRLRTLSRAVEQCPASIMITDANGVIEYINPKFGEVTGYTAAEVVGHKPSLLKSGETPEGTYRELWARIAAGGEWRGEFINRKKNGATFRERAVISALRNAAGKITHYVGVKEDVTEMRALEQRLLRVQRLETINRLAGGIAHDLNNVLAPILMALQMLRERYAAAPDQALLESLEFSARRGADVIKQLLTFARGSEGTRTRLQPRLLLKEMARIILETFPKNIRFRSQVGPDLWEVCGEATHLHQVLMNLCLNARDAMPQGGALTLAAENVQLDRMASRLSFEAKPGPYVHLCVADTGEGIPAENLEKIFEPFFTTKGPQRGTGLGLATALGIVRSHGGFLHVESRVGRGSDFNVYLPAFPEPSLAGSEAPAAPLPRGQGELILVVDDEQIVREVTRKVLEANGYRVLTAADGTEALAAYVQQREAVKLVLTDLAMPVMDGEKTIRALRLLAPTLKVIVASGEETEVRAADPARLGAQAFLAKPFSADTLLATLQRVLLTA